MVLEYSWRADGGAPVVQHQQLAVAHAFSAWQNLLRRRQEVLVLRSGVEASARKPDPFIPKIASGRDPLIPKIASGRDPKPA